MRAVENGKSRDALRMPHARVPGERPAPVVAHDRGLLRAERGHEARDILRENVDPVGVQPARLVALPIASQVGRDDSMARLREHRNLVAPRCPVLGKAVEEKHQRAAAGTCLRAVEGDSVSQIDAAVRCLHCRAILRG